MTVAQYIGTVLNSISAVTNIVSTRIYHGLRLKGVITMPAINYYVVTKNVFGVDRDVYSINCRAENIDTALALAKTVRNTFCDTNGFGMTGCSTAFSAYRISLVMDHGIIPEVDTGIYNAPVDISIVY